MYEKACKINFKVITIVIEKTGWNDHDLAVKVWVV